jgi:acetolactate synthase-1/2/3 large subunit
MTAHPPAANRPVPPFRPRTIAHLVLDAMRLAGVRQLFCIPGVQNDDFFDVVVDNRDWLDVIVCRHEQGAAYMAMGAAQATGRPAAMCVVPGPGMLNAAAGLSSACGGGARVMAVVGQIASPLLGRGWRVLHELDDQPAVLAQVTKHVGVVRDPSSAVAVVQGVADALVSGTPRPVAIEVPADLWSAPISGEITAPSSTMPSFDRSQVERVADRLARAERPLIWVGTGAQDASASVRELADTLQAPVSTRRMGHGVVDELDPLFAPFPLGRELWGEADVVLGIGTRLEFPLLQWGTAGLEVIQINTDEAELTRHPVERGGIHGDAAAVVPALVDCLGGASRPDRRPEMANRRAEFFARIAHLEPQLSYLAAIRAALPEDAVIVEDVTQMTFVAHFAYPFRQPRTFLSTGFAGTLGSAAAVVIGAKAALPDRAVVAIAGDGGFLFTATELASAVQHDIRAITIVFNDQAYGNVLRIQTERFGAERTIASQLVNPEIVAFAASFGCLGLRATSPTELSDALRTALAHDGPTVIEVPVGPVPSPWPFLRMPPVRFTESEGP